MARDPLAVIPSAMSLVIGVLDRAVGFWSQPEAIRRRWLDRMYKAWVLLLHKFHEDWTAGVIDKKRVFIVRYDRMMMDFEGLMDDMCTFLGHEMTPPLRATIAKKGETQRKYESEHKYDLAKYGLTEERDPQGLRLLLRHLPPAHRIARAGARRQARLERFSGSKRGGATVAERVLPLRLPPRWNFSRRRPWAPRGNPHDEPCERAHVTSMPPRKIPSGPLHRVTRSAPCAPPVGPPDRRYWERPFGSIRLSRSGSGSLSDRARSARSGGHCRRRAGSGAGDAVEGTRWDFPGGIEATGVLSRRSSWGFPPGAHGRRRGKSQRGGSRSGRTAPRP